MENCDKIIDEIEAYLLNINLPFKTADDQQIKEKCNLLKRVLRMLDMLCTDHARLNVGRISDQGTGNFPLAKHMEDDVTSRLKKYSETKKIQRFPPAQHLRPQFQFNWESKCTTTMSPLLLLEKHL